MQKTAGEIQAWLRQLLVDFEELERDQVDAGRGWCVDIDVATAALAKAEGYYAKRAEVETQLAK